MNYIYLILFFIPFICGAQINCDSLTDRSKFTGYCVEYHLDGGTSKQWYKKGQPTGRYYEYYENGKFFAKIEVVSDKKLTMKGETFFNNGNIRTMGMLNSQELSRMEYQLETLLFTTH